MGDTLLSKDEGIQSNKRRKSEITISSATLNPGKSELKRHVQFLPDDSLVQIHEISPRSIKSPDSDDSTESTDSSESDTDSESDSTSSSETSSEEGAHVLRKSKIEVFTAKANTLSALKHSLISRQTWDHQANKTVSLKFNQSTQAYKNVGENNKLRPNLSTATNQMLPKTRSLLTRTNSTLGASRPSRPTVPAKIVNFNTLARRSSFPAKKRPLLPARKAASARRVSEGSLTPPASISNVQTSQTDETFARLSKSLQSLTIEDAFIFPSIETYELKLPTLIPPNTNNNMQETLPTNGRHFETSPPKSETGEQKNVKPTLQEYRHSAWQMANGSAEDALERKPNIAQLWESTQNWPEF